MGTSVERQEGGRVPGGGRMSRIERRKRETRKRLLEAALELFSRKGLHMTRVEEITERADIGKGSFYEHFRNKDGLICQLLHEGYEELIRIFETQISPSDDLEARVRGVLRAHWILSSREVGYFRFFQQVRGLIRLKEGGADRIRQEYRRFIQRLVDLVLSPEERAIPRRREEMAVIICALAGCVSGYLSHRVVLGGELPAEAELEFLESVLLPGLLKFHLVPVRGGGVATQPGS